MFKALRDRLRGFTKKVESGMDVAMEERLEAELKKAMAADPPGPAPLGGASAATAPPKAPKEPGSSVPSPPAAKASDEPSPAQPASPPASQPPPRGPQSTPSRAPTPPPQPSEVRPPQEGLGTAPAPEVPTRSAPEKAPPTPPAAVAPKAAPRYGRKTLSEREIEERLERELSTAVETQREVEAAAGPTGATRYTINEDVLDDALWELELALLESDVALPVVEAIKGNVREQLLTMAVGGRNPHEVVEAVLRGAVRRVLNVDPIDFDAFVRQRLASGKKPVVVMFVGVNGTGKTTSIARIAHRLKSAGIGSVMAAGDTFRAGAIEQLSLHGERLGIAVVKQKAGADPAAVCYDAIEHAKARGKEVVLLDTAGRMQTNTNLMDEMDKIRRVANPDLVVFVGDSLAGNDAVEQARRFDEVVDIDGAILTKVDVDAKGGAALSVAYTINKPLLFVGVGQDYGDLRPFDADWMVDRLFGEDEAARHA